MAASLPGFFNLQVLTDSGVPAVGHRLYTYTAGTTTHKAAYTDAAGTIPHTYISDGSGGVYIALNARGELPAPLFLASGAYDVALKTPAGATVWTRYADGTDQTATLSAALALGFSVNGSNELVATTRVVSPRFEGTNTDDADTPDATFRVNRTLGNGTTASGHGFRDQTTFSRGTGSSYAAFDSQVSLAGGDSHDHVAGFQARNIMAGSLSAVHWYNFVSSPVFNSGTVTNNYGFYCYNPTGAGTVTNNYGFYIPLQSKGSVLNFSGYIAQQGAPFYCGAPLQLNNLLTVNPAVPFYVGGATTSGFPWYGYNYNPTTDDKAVNDVAVSTKLDNFGMRVYVKATGAPLGTSGMLATMTEALRVGADGNLLLNVNTSAPALGANQQMVFALTSNTNLRISVRGTDGVTRTANITLS